MGAADGPAYAPPTEGAKSRIEADPCGCPECVAGPGLEPPKSLLDIVLGTTVKVVCFAFCPGCRDNVITTSVKAGSGWSNACKDGHTWHTFD